MHTLLRNEFCRLYLRALSIITIVPFCLIDVLCSVYVVANNKLSSKWKGREVFRWVVVFLRASCRQFRSFRNYLEKKRRFAKCSLFAMVPYVAVVLRIS